MSESLPFVLDTDIGDDIDDALALCLALRCPELRLRGVTTVFLDGPRRALLSRKLLKAWGRAEVEVVAGCSRPLLSQGELPSLGTQFEVLDAGAGWDETAHAVDFLLRAAREHGQNAPDTRLTIVCIGPLTNIAATLARAPEWAQQVRIVLMGGQWSAPFAEWNVLQDPEAAAMVFRSGAEISMVGLDVTQGCQLSEGDIARLEAAGDEGRALLGRMTRLWQRQHAHAPILHDPLTVLALVEDGLLTWDDKRIEVELCGPERGVTRVGEGAPNCRVAVDVDSEGAAAAFMRRLMG